MITYKTLMWGGVGRYSGFRWPKPSGRLPGAWVAVEGPVRPGANAIHACRIEQLPWWLDTELWQCELTEPVQEAELVLLSRRGRLLRPVSEWNEETAQDFIRACVERSRKNAGEAIRKCGADDLVASLNANEPELLYNTVASEHVPAPLAEVLLATADAIFASRSAMSTCLVAHLAARVSRNAARAMEETAWDKELAERRWQAQWLREHLQLRPADQPS